VPCCDRIPLDVRLLVLLGRYQVSVLRVNAAARLESLKNDAGRKEAQLQEEVVMRTPTLMAISSRL
jgi:hypothetical protein